jgi:hypothetical protein
MEIHKILLMLMDQPLSMLTKIVQLSYYNSMIDSIIQLLFQHYPVYLEYSPLLIHHRAIILIYSMSLILTTNHLDSNLMMTYLKLYKVLPRNKLNFSYKNQILTLVSLL